MMEVCDKFRHSKHVAKLSNAVTYGMEHRSFKDNNQFSNFANPCQDQESTTHGDCNRNETRAAIFTWRMTLRVYSSYTQAYTAALVCTHRHCRNSVAPIQFWWPPWNENSAWWMNWELRFDSIQNDHLVRCSKLRFWGVFSILSRRLIRNSTFGVWLSTTPISVSLTTRCPSGLTYFGRK